MRAFFAIFVPDYLGEEMANILNILKKEAVFRDIKWSSCQNLHITLRFLGNIRKATCEKIEEDASHILSGSKAFSICFSDLLLFPNPALPVAIALKPTNNSALTEIAIAIYNCVSRYDVHKETRQFNPHITLGRIKHRFIKEEDKEKACKILSSLDFNREALKFDVSSISLMQSKPTSHGSDYIILKEFPLLNTK